MHVASTSPLAVSTEELSEDAIARERSVYETQVAEEGKPEKIIPRIVEGKLAKWKKEQSLLEQAFVKNPDINVGKFQDETGGVRIVEFIRLEVGEGIEKEEANLADEVAAQLRGDA